MAFEKAWNRAQEALASKVSKPSYESWVKPVIPVSFEDGVAVLGTPSRFAKHWLEGKYLADIKNLLEEELGREIRVVIKHTTDDEQPAILQETLPPVRKRDSAAEEPLSLPLNSRYNFDSFVVGPSNRLAHATAFAISQAPGRTYNPLFVYGRPGIGKTHLLHAIGVAIQQNLPGLRVAYISGETFTFQYVTALREHRIAEFRRRLRSVDVWLVDDIQFLVGKERTEEEFFHTYNALYDSGKQVVLTSDRAPKDLELDSRLLSRFECGMVADVAPPDLETRMAILQAKAAAEHFTLSDDVIAYVAKLIQSNIRQLEGALIKLHAYAALMKTPVDKNLAKEVLGGYFSDSEETLPLDPRLVQLAVSRKFQVPVDDITGKKRSQNIVLARQVAMYLSRELTNASLPVIGHAFGGKDHSTVLHSIRKVKLLIESDPNIAAAVSEIFTELKNGSS
ncbi:MAG: chromosomal replication initiator protein DnaA [Armatimonadetes bacterium]|nr:chromosomal replication initiator protein DnaA [Armatimonadota bacterium]